MLKTSVLSNASGTTLKLEGLLVGSSVDELENLWQILRVTARQRPICVDLDDVKQLSGAAIELLDLMREDGVVVVDRGHRASRPSKESEEHHLANQ
jgi:ABC-type transporter Mla MlaB component